MYKETYTTDSTIEEVRQRLDSWRKVKKNHREPIPKDFWQAAADLARTHSVNSVSKALCLIYTDLKLHTYSSTKPKEKKNKKPSFVELLKLTSLPLIIVYLFAQEKIERGMIAGALKNRLNSSINIKKMGRMVIWKLKTTTKLNF